MEFRQMNIMRDELNEPVLSVIFADKPEELETIHKPQCAAAIWERKPLPVFQSWIDGLNGAALPQARLILKPHAVRVAVLAICDDAGPKNDPMKDLLIDDIAALADVFSSVMKASYVRLRLDVVTDNACKKFHIDALTARLVCTYRGTGTQYGIATHGASPQQVFTVPTGAPVIVRGSKYPTSPKSNLLHRSPPIEGTGETRFVLVLDPAFTPDEDV